MLTITIILAVIWIAASAWTRLHGRVRAHCVDTRDGPVWVEGGALPGEGQALTVYGHFDQGSGRYERGRAQRGRLTHQCGAGYTWEPSGRNRYA